jgi:hypothetical protein
MSPNNNDKTQKIVLKFNEPPIIIMFEGKEGIREYVLKTNTEKTKLLLNKKEY